MASPQQHLIALLAGVASGNEAAFAELYQASSSKLLAVAIRIVKQREVAEEILQEAFVKIWERAGDFDASIAAPMTWMATIVRNRSLDEVRKRAGKSFVNDGELDHLVSEDESALSLLERDDDVARLMRCLETLEPDKRQMVRLAYLDGMSREALAETFDKPEGTVKTWLRRSLMQLKGCLDG